MKTLKAYLFLSTIFRISCFPLMFKKVVYALPKASSCFFNGPGLFLKMPSKKSGMSSRRYEINISNSSLMSFSIALSAVASVSAAMRAVIASSFPSIMAMHWATTWPCLLNSVLLARAPSISPAFSRASHCSYRSFHFLISASLCLNSLSRIFLASFQAACLPGISITPPFPVCLSLLDLPLVSLCHAFYGGRGIGKSHVGCLLKNDLVGLHRDLERPRPFPRHFGLLQTRFCLRIRAGKQLLELLNQFHQRILIAEYALTRLER